MTSMANRAFDAQPNVLRGQTTPNTMGGLGVAVVSAGDPWRGPTEARWVARLLRGAPPPHDRTSGPVGFVAHG